jgi:CHAT domain-containing protein
MTDDNERKLISSRGLFRLTPKLVRFLPASLCLAVSLLSGVCLNARDSANVVELTVRKPVAGEVAPGDSEHFEIFLTRGEIFQVSVEKGDLAMALELLGPEGQRLTSQVSRRYESLNILVNTNSTGVYKLEIRSLESEARGSFKLEVKATRTATSTDQNLNLAQQSFANANLLRSSWNEKSLREALEKYESAATVLLSIKEFRNAALALLAAAETYNILGEYRTAIERYQRAAEIARTSGASLQEAQALSQLGALYSYTGKNDMAEEYSLRAFSLLTNNDSENPSNIQRQAYAEALRNEGEINYSRGNLVRSSAAFDQALKIFKEVGDRTGEARTRLFKGYIGGALGDPNKAVDEISRALNLYKAVGNKAGEALCLTALGLAHSSEGNHDRALQMHRQAKDLFVGIGDRQSEAITLNAIGQAYELLRDYATALDNYKQALALAQANGTLEIVAGSLFKLGRLYRLLGDFGQSQISYENCLRISRAAGKRRMQATVLNDIAQLYASQRNRDRTLAQYRKLLIFYNTIKDRRGAATVLNNLGDFYLKLGDQKAAIEQFTTALPLSEEVGDKDLLTSTLFHLACAKREAGMLEDALTSIRRSIGVIEELRTNVSLPEFRISYFSGARKHYDLCIDILMQLNRQQPEKGFAKAALLVSESARARSLLDTLTEINVDTSQTTPDELLTRERELRGLLRSHAQYQMELSLNGVNPAERESIAAELSELRSRYQEVQAQLREKVARSEFSDSAPPNIEEVQAELHGSDTMLLEFALGDERSYLWAVTEHSILSYELPPRVKLESAERELYESVTARQVVGQKIDGDYQAKIEASDRAYRKQAQELSQLLLGQVANQLITKRLVIVVEGTLQYVPWEALPLPNQQSQQNDNSGQLSMANDSLIGEHEIISLPSLATLTAIRHEKRTPDSSDKVVAIVGDPVFDKNDERVKRLSTNYVAQVAAAAADEGPVHLRQLVNKGGMGRLIHAQDETNAILAATPRGTAMVATGFEANREIVTNAALGEYQIVHFATHGFFNSDHPEFSGILLSMLKRDGTSTDGFVPLQDIYAMRLASQLVVVSACDTALGEDVRGEGLVGLTRGFLSAGSRSVVTSLWKVDDRATAELMKYFYQSMLQDGEPPSTALRTAKQRIRQQAQWNAPYFWAGFVFNGEYKEEIKVNHDSTSRKTELIVAAVLLVSLGFLLRRYRRVSGTPLDY